MRTLRTVTYPMNLVLNRHCLEAVLRAIFPQIILLLTAVGLFGRSYWMLLPTAMMFVAVPLLDFLIGEHKTDVDKTKVHPQLRKVLSYSTVTYVFLFYVCLFWMLYLVPDFSTLELIACVVSFASAGGVLAAAGHELIHRPSLFKRIVGEIPFISFGYWHFTIAHIRNHHAHVATDKDNHAPDLNTSFWRYLLESYPKSYAESSRIVAEKMKKKGISKFSLKNPYIAYFGVPVAILGISYLMGGALGMFLYVGLCVATILFSEAAFYLEHYGLHREEHETVAPAHSWDSYHRFSNYQTFMVQRHADHHLNAGNEYVYLRSHESSQRLPLGYPLLSLLAFFPKPFFRLMNDRIREDRVDPSREDKLVAS